MNEYLETPILFCTYRRPETTRMVFEAIRNVKPKRLFVSANAPNPHKLDEEKRCNEVRQIVSQVDWDCELHTLFRDEHLDLKSSIKGAIDWFFDHVEEGIILEDDCLPGDDFFYFCQELLAHYRDDNRVMNISGCNHGINDSSSSYYFSQHIHIWGWATWKRAWELYDVEMKQWPLFKEKVDFTHLFGSDKEAARRFNNWEMSYNGKIDCWDYQWSFCVICNGGLSILPGVNLIKNLGINMDATHTTDTNTYHVNLEVEKFMFPIKHEPFYIVRRDLDIRYNQLNAYKDPSLKSQILHKFKTFLSNK